MWGITDSTSQAPAVVLQATMTCPECGVQQQVVMPETHQQHYYKCTNQECLADLAPKEGSCCVFCSYADKPCPQRQLQPEDEKPKLHSLI